MSKFENNLGPVPDRWLNCPRKADKLIIEKFLAFKTPLSSEYNVDVPPKCRFLPNMLFDACRNKKIKLGLWVDLTNTNRFYDKKEIESKNCKYLKLACRGHGECPSEEVTQNFVRLIDEFISKHPLDVIGVHCTHGFNRTGFLIVSYLVQKCDCSLDVALHMFADARPPGIYKGDYIEELYRRYDDISGAISPPLRPDWDADVENFDQTRASTSLSGNQNKKEPKFMEGVPGVSLLKDHAKMRQLQLKVRNICRWKRNEFPGCQPVTMDRKNKDLLKDYRYKVSWKADGMRYLMLIDGPNEIYFFDRDNNVFQVQNLTFPCRKEPHKHLTDTLLDGEMVIDKVAGQDIPRFLVYDIVQFMGMEVGKATFSVRLQCIQNEIIHARQLAMEKRVINRAEEPFSVRKKDFWDISQAENLLGPKFAASLAHEPDGLIFQPEDDPYVAGRCDKVLKWKPTELNSVDFRMQTVKEQKEGCIPTTKIYLYVGQLSEPFDFMKYNPALKGLDGKIIECKLERNQWVFMRERTDKSFPNSYNTAQSVLNSIKNPFTKVELLEFIRSINQGVHDKEMMPPPNKRAKTQSRCLPSI